LERFFLFPSDDDKMAEVFFSFLFSLLLEPYPISDLGKFFYNLFIFLFYNYLLSKEKDCFT
jgi:hypothetical protein